MPRLEPLCLTTDIPAGQGRPFTIDAHQIAVFHVREKPLFGAERSRFLAVTNTCSHAFARLDGSPVLRGCRIVCPLHGAAFSLKSGQALNPPAYEPIRRYRLVVKGEELSVELPD